MTLPAFESDFGYSKKHENTVSSIAVGIQQAAALVGCFAVWPLTHRYGRRVATMVSSFFFCIGVVIEVINTHTTSSFYVGRVVAGLGLGGSTTIIPIYLSEMSPTDMRGRLGSCYQLAYTVGIMVSYWIAYGAKYMSKYPGQWQMPISLQLVPAFFMGAGMLTLKESVRWLLFHRDIDRAWESLVWIRASDSEEVELEFAQMKQGVEEERRATANVRPKELLEWPNARRILLGFAMFLAQQNAGATSLAYYAPQFFTALVGKNSGNKPLLLSGIFGAVKVIACFAFVSLFGDRFGRRPVLIFGALGMAACLIITAAVLKTHPAPDTPVVTHAGIATVAMIYLFVMLYNFSWGPLPWPCTSEIFQTRIREIGVGVAVGSQWLFNFVWSFSARYMISWSTWGTFLLFGFLNILNALFVWACVKETAGKTLEEIAAMFGSGSGDLENVVQSKLASGEHRETDDVYPDAHKASAGAN